MCNNIVTVPEDYNNDINSLGYIIREIDKENTNIIISKDIRRFKKLVTVVRGLQNRADMRSLTTELKRKIGTGGTYKDGQIILQGDHREIVKNMLIAKGFKHESIQII
jgi:translation initiation factor 1